MQKKLVKTLKKDLLTEINNISNIDEHISACEKYLEFFDKNFKLCLNAKKCIRNNFHPSLKFHKSQHLPYFPTHLVPVHLKDEYG